MTTNFYLNPYDQKTDQLLLEDLIIESIQMYGYDMIYIPRTLNSYEPVYGNDDQSSYTQAIQLEMYIKSIFGFAGEKSIMTALAGLDINDKVVFSISRRRFANEVEVITDQPRPNEGDLIYFPLNKKCFQIKFVDFYEMFYQLGALYTWEVTCELFEYSNEILNTGISDIDSLQTAYSFDELNFALMDTDNTYILDTDSSYIELKDVDEALPQNDSKALDTEVQNYIDFSIHNPYSEKS